MSSRRDFLKTLFAGVGALAIPKINFSSNLKSLKKITILHTNDTHSQIEALPTTHNKYPRMGGYAARSAFFNNIRSEGNPMLIFDSGDFFQGTPYYNVYGGKIEIELMSQMGYSGVNIGNHEFDNGLDSMANTLSNADFDIISSNYIFNNDLLKSRVKSYKIYTIDSLKIGVFGLGINPKGLIGTSQFGNTRFVDPVRKAAEMAYTLKKEKGCNMVVCLSHLGLNSSENGIGDFELAKQSKNIDLILGGHSHTLLQKPITIYNSDDNQVVICQNGYAGIQVSRIDAVFTQFNELIFINSNTTKISKNQA